MSTKIIEGTEEIQVLYVYKCPECVHHGETHQAGDGHEGESAQCSVCGAAVHLEWDGGVVLERLPSSSAN
ncbi:hypothetical protein [Massilia sp. TWP1-3-3]|uniref:hypothetical protein n=1 Tax=Massilia sp. TWP1-3-3 TaxID=2804573 RepID=UPI003CF18141